MAKFEMANAKETISALKIYRSGWANEIREGWTVGTLEAREVLYALYEISGTIILALENRINGVNVDSMAIRMTHDKLKKFVKSDIFDKFSALGEIGACGVITSATKHHIRVMFEALEALLKF